MISHLPSLFRIIVNDFFEAKLNIWLPKIKQFGFNAW